MLGHSGVPAGKTLSELLQVVLIFTGILFPVSLLVPGMCLAALGFSTVLKVEGRHC